MPARTHRRQDNVVFTFEDIDSGFTKSYFYPWPTEQSIIGNPDFADVFLRQAEAQFETDLAQALYPRTPK